MWVPTWEPEDEPEDPLDSVLGTGRPPWVMMLLVVVLIFGIGFSLAALLT